MTGEKKRWEGRGEEISCASLLLRFSAFRTYLEHYRVIQWKNKTKAM